MTQRVVGTALLLCLFACLGAQPALSDTANASGLEHLFASDTTGAAVDIGANAPTINMFRYTLGLMVVLGLLLLLYYVLRRLTGHSGVRRGTAGMTILASYPLNNRQSLMLARMLDTVYVLAVGTDRVTLVDKIDDPATIEQLIGDQPDAQKAGQFAGLLEKFRKQGQ